MNEHSMHDRRSKAADLVQEARHGRRHPETMPPRRGPEPQCRNLDSGASKPRGERTFISQRHNEDFEASAIEPFDKQRQLTFGAADVERGDDVRNLDTRG